MEDTAQGFKLIKAGRLIDGGGGPPIEDGAVLVRGSKIIAVGPAKDVIPPEGALVEAYNYPGQTVMPGLIDCHTHHNGFGDGRPGEDVAALPDEVITLQAARNARDSLFSGVTSIRDNGAKNMTMFRLREAVQHGIIQAPPDGIVRAAYSHRWWTHGLLRNRGDGFGGSHRRGSPAD